MRKLFLMPLFLLLIPFFSYARDSRVHNPPPQWTDNGTAITSVDSAKQIIIGTSGDKTVIDPTTGVSTPQIGINRAPSTLYWLAMPTIAGYNNYWSKDGNMFSSNSVQTKQFIDADNGTYLIDPNLPTTSAVLAAGIKIGNQTQITGITQFITFASGVSPAGSMTSGAIIYCRDGQLWVNGTAGDHTQLTQHDPVTGEPYHNSYNVYTGLGRRIWLVSGVKEEYSVQKLNPEEEFRKAWIQDYIAKKTIIVQSVDETKEPTKIVPTQEEANLAAETGYRFDWKTMPPFVRAAWGK